MAQPFTIDEVNKMRKDAKGLSLWSPENKKYLDKLNDPNFVDRVRASIPQIEYFNDADMSDGVLNNSEWILNTILDSDQTYYPNRIKGISINNPINLPEVTVTPSKIQSDFFKQNKITNPNFFDRVYYDVNTDKFYRTAESPEIIDRFYNLWDKMGRPNIIQKDLKHNIVSRAHTDNISNIYLGMNDQMDTAISELSHFAQNRNNLLDTKATRGGNFLDAILTAEELFPIYNRRYDIPGTVEYDTHEVIEPSLIKYVYTGQPSKYIPEKSYTKFGNGVAKFTNAFIPQFKKFKVPFKYIEQLIK